MGVGGIKVLADTQRLGRHHRTRGEFRKRFDVARAKLTVTIVAVSIAMAIVGNVRGSRRRTSAHKRPSAPQRQVTVFTTTPDSLHWAVRAWRPRLICGGESIHESYRSQSRVWSYTTADGWSPSR